MFSKSWSALGIQKLAISGKRPSAKCSILGIMSFHSTKRQGGISIAGCWAVLTAFGVFIPLAQWFRLDRWISECFRKQRGKLDRKYVATPGYVTNYHAKIIKSFPKRKKRNRAWRMSKTWRMWPRGHEGCGCAEIGKFSSRVENAISWNIIQQEKMNSKRSNVMFVLVYENQ